MRKIAPHPYQRPIISALVASLRTTGKALLVMATGTGKTLTTAYALRRLLKANERTIFLCHSEDILRHAMGEFRKVFGNDPAFGVFTGKQKYGEDVAPFVFATLQTVHLHHEAFSRDDFTVVVVDEGHHSQAETYKVAIEWFTPKFRLGMTATPDRLDRKDIRELFGDETATLTLEESIAKGYLTPMVYKLMTIGSLADGALEQLVKEAEHDGRRISLSQLNETLFIEQMDEEIAAAINAEPGKKIVFCENTVHAGRTAKGLDKSACYHSKLPSAKNKETFDAFARGDLGALVTVNMFNEGVDMPDADVVVFLRSTNSPTIFMQQLGRGLRRAPGKKRVTILDFVGNAERIVAVQELINKIAKYRDGDEDPDTDVDGEDDDLPRGPRQTVVLSGQGYDFQVSSQVLDIMEILSRANNYYPTLAEASAAARRLGIKTSIEYSGREGRYKEDSRLPCNPYEYYPDWEDWPSFLGTNNYYPTLAEASAAARKLGIKTAIEYRGRPGQPGRYKEDLRLYSNPNKYYPDWVDFPSFLGTNNYYPTLAEASAAARRLGIKTGSQYNGKKGGVARYKEDSRLPSDPSEFYSDWVNWPTFLGTAKKDRF